MKNILIVDDLSIDRMLTRVAIDAMGPSYQVTSANDGEAACQLIKTSRFDLILLDVKMPRIDGFDLLERLSVAGTGHAPVIIVSGSGLDVDRARARALGAVDYIQKAVDFTAFKEELRVKVTLHCSR